MRHLCLVVRTGCSLRDTNGKSRKVVEEERVEVIVGDDDDSIGPGASS
jgi:hypothetical protein